MSLAARVSVVLLSALLCVVANHPPAHAVTDLGQVCLLLSELDTIRVALTLHDGPAPLVSAVFRWRNTSPSFHVIGTGSLTQSVSGGSFDLGLVGTVNSAAPFGGHRTCSIFATLTPPAFNGSWQLTCTGGATNPFTASGTLSIIDCTAAMDR